METLTDVQAFTIIYLMCQSLGLIAAFFMVLGGKKKKGL